MKAVRCLAVLFAIALALCAPLSVRACPLCADAIANSNSANDADDVDQFPAAMNQSIYLMLGVPYTAFGVVGLMVYYGVRKNEEYRREQAGLNSALLRAHG
ncbi:MAG: hypothetical protein EXR98_12745 [Gemmataceae bacterium]|nr:hypothetical protein [Gemmataceae bacterium]